MRHLLPLLIALPLALPACARDGDPANDQAAQVAAVDAALIGNTAASAGDPALTAALRDQIMVDPALVQQANDDVVRPPTAPLSGAMPPDGVAVAAMKSDPLAGEKLRPAPPAAAGSCRQCAIARRALTLGALAQAQGGATGQCAARVTYSAGWANRLPAATPLFPDARVAEAAGADGDGCALRVVSFVSAQPMQRLLDFYYTRTTAAGFDAQHQAEGVEHVLAVTKTGGGAFLAMMRPHAAGGTDVDLMVDAH